MVVREGGKIITMKTVQPASMFDSVYEGGTLRTILLENTLSSMIVREEGD